MMQNKKFTLRKTATYGLVGCILAGGMMVAILPHSEVHAEMTATVVPNKVKETERFVVNASDVQSKRVRQRLQIVMPDGKTHDIIHDELLSRVDTPFKNYVYMNDLYLENGLDHFNPVNMKAPLVGGYKANVDFVKPEMPNFQSKDANYKITYQKDSSAKDVDSNLVVRRYHFVFPDKEEIVRSHVTVFENLLSTDAGQSKDKHIYTYAFNGMNTSKEVLADGMIFTEIPGYKVVTSDIVKKLEAKDNGGNNLYSVEPTKDLNEKTADSDVYIYLEKVPYKYYELSFTPDYAGKNTRTIELVNRKNEKDVIKLPTDSVSYTNWSVQHLYIDANGKHTDTYFSNGTSYQNDNYQLPMRKLPVSLKDYRVSIVESVSPAGGAHYVPEIGYTEDATHINSQTVFNDRGRKDRLESYVTFSKGDDKYGQTAKVDSLPGDFKAPSRDGDKTETTKKPITVLVMDADGKILRKMQLVDIDVNQDVTDSKEFNDAFPKEDTKVVDTKTETNKEGETTVKVEVDQNKDDSSKDENKTEKSYTANVLVIDESDKDKKQTNFTIENVKDSDKVVELDAFKAKFPTEKYEIVDAKKMIEDGKYYAEIYVKHQLVEKDGEPKKITRTIVMHDPKTNKMTKHSDSVEFASKVMVDAVTGENTGKVKYLQDELSFKDFELPTYEGYASNINEIEYTKAKPTDDAETTIDVHWFKTTDTDKTQNMNYPMMQESKEQTQEKTAETTTSSSKQAKSTAETTTSSSEQAKPTAKTTSTSTQNTTTTTQRLPQAGSQEIKGLAVIGALLASVGGLGLAIRKKLGL